MLIESSANRWETLDPDYFKECARRSNILSCIQCGTCSASCPSGHFTALRTRTIVKRCIQGDLSVLIDPDIWLCTTCYTCYERCPRDVRPTDVIIELRNYASKLGHIHPIHRKVVEFLKETGHAVPINEETKARRLKLGLPELPPTIYKYKDEPDCDLKQFGTNLFNLAPEKI
ncbi:MAG: CoB--CoM heterodisulfide reductase subunit C [Promethearchaeota archaeon]